MSGEDVPGDLAALRDLESVILPADTGAAERLREQLTRIYGPEIMHDALDTDEAQSYFAALAELRAEQEAFAAELPGRAQGIADLLSEGLPDGMRFEWTSGDE